MRSPRLRGMGGFAGHYRRLGATRVIVEWRLGDGSQLRLSRTYCRAGASSDVREIGRILYASAEIPGAPQSATFALLPMT
jgi:hypothetical protein